MYRIFCPRKKDCRRRTLANVPFAATASCKFIWLARECSNESKTKQGCKLCICTKHEIQPGSVMLNRLCVVISAMPRVNRDERGHCTANGGGAERASTSQGPVTCMTLLKGGRNASTESSRTDFSLSPLHPPPTSYNFYNGCPRRCPRMCSVEDYNVST